MVRGDAAAFSGAWTVTGTSSFLKSGILTRSRKTASALVESIHSIVNLTGIHATVSIGVGLDGAEL